VLAVLALAACGSTRPAGHAQAVHIQAAQPVRWSALRTVKGVVDLSGPRSDGSVVVAAAGRLWLRAAATGSLKPFAPGYGSPAGLEAYIALAGGRSCFHHGATYALRLAHGDGVTVVSASGHTVSKFAGLPSAGLENGIAFDQTGGFGHRLLVTATRRGHTTVFALDCHGHVQVLTRTGPRVEGGIAVAPAAFGRFGGDLIAPDEISGRIYAIAPNGTATPIVQSGIPHGQDIGVESEGFVPRSYGLALVADRLTPGNPHPGDNLILALTRATLAAAGVRAGELLAVAEGGAQTVAVSCARTCSARTVALGPPRAHVEGHVTFTG